MRLHRPVLLGGLVAAVLVGCQSEPAKQVATCEGADGAATYRTKGKALVGDVDGDGTGDRVTLRVDKPRPARCRHVLVVQLAGGETAVATVPPLPWPGGDPQLLLLAEIDGRSGLEPAVALSPANVYRPGVVFTLSRGALRPLRRERAAVPEFVHFYDEFPAGVDCAGQPGAIVVTHSRISDRGDRWWEVTRSFYRAAGTRFVHVRDALFEVEVGDEATRRWPEVRGDPFLSCPGRIG